MIKTTVAIEGMHCSMCESHINDVVRKNFKVKKVTSSHKKNQTVILSEEAPEEQALRNAIVATGYKTGEIVSDTAVKKGLFW